MGAFCDFETLFISEKCKKVLYEVYNGEEMHGICYLHSFGKLGVVNYEVSNEVKACLATSEECACMLGKPQIIHILTDSWMWNHGISF